MTKKSNTDTGAKWNPDESAYEGRTDNPTPDTDAARRGPAAGAGPTQSGQGRSSGDTDVEGGGARGERE